MRILLVLISILTFVCFSVGYWRLDRMHDQMRLLEIENSALNTQQYIEKRLLALVAEMRTKTPRFVNERGEPIQKRFHSVSRKLISQRPYIEVVAWSPLVEQSWRVEFEQWQRDRLPNYEIWAANDSGSDEKAQKPKAGQEYLPVLMVEPKPLLTVVAGLDMNRLSKSSDRYALNALRSSGAVALMTPRTELFSSSTSSAIALLMLPVEDKAAVASDAFLGMLVFGVDMEALLATELKELLGDKFDFRLLDEGRLHTSEVLSLGELENVSASRQLQISTPFERSWLLTLAPSDKFVKQMGYEFLQLVLLCLCCFVVCGLLCIQLIRLQKNKVVEQIDGHAGQLQLANEKLNRSNRELEALSKVDSLTSLENRRSFDLTLDSEWKRALRNRSSLAVIVIDVDHFKLYNDHYGHVQGDECLRKISSELRHVFNRSGDFIARYGGEEFAVIAANTGGEIMKLAEKSRRAIEKLALPHAASPTAPIVSISVGVSSVIPDSHLLCEDLVKSADQGLYLAKEHGRNQVNYHICLQCVPGDETGVA